MSGIDIYYTDILELGLQDFNENTKMTIVSLFLKLESWFFASDIVLYYILRNQRNMYRRMLRGNFMEGGHKLPRYSEMSPWIGLRDIIIAVKEMLQNSNTRN